MGLGGRAARWVKRQLGIEALELGVHVMGLRLALLERRVGLLSGSSPTGGGGGGGASGASGGGAGGDDFPEQH